MTEEAPAPRRRVPFMSILFGTGVLACLGFLVVLVLDKPSSAGLVPSVTNSVMYADTQTATRTSTPVPTPTIGIEATAASVNLTSQSVLRTAEAVNLAVAGMTQEARQIEAELRRMENERLAWTAQADGWTAQAFPTYSLYTQSAYSTNVALNVAGVTAQAERLHATLAAPTTAKLMAVLDTEKRYKPRNEAVTLFAMVITSTGVLVGFSALLFYVVTRKEKPPIVPLNLPKKFIEVEQNLWKPIDYDIPCTWEQLHAFADGVINRGALIGIRNWQAAPWDRESSIAFREWLADNRLTRPAIREGERDMTEELLEWLRECLEFGYPPPPYRCMSETTPPLDTERESRSVEAEGEGING